MYLFRIKSNHWDIIDIFLTYFLATGVLGENMFKSESTDLEGVTLIFIESFYRPH